MNYNITYSTYTDKGDREINEDSIGVFNRNDDMCFILCDGLGGHGMGDAASSLVVNVFESMFKQNNISKSFISDAFSAAQDILLAEQEANNCRMKMKTTAAVLRLDGKRAYIGYIGDSRVYVFDKNQIKMRTFDHSIPQMLVMTGDIKEEEIRHHPDRNRVLRVMGTEWNGNQYELIKPYSLKKCKAFLLCSDGFWEFIEEKDMCELLNASENVEKWLSNMIKVAYSNGKDKNMDNISAIAVWIEKI